MNKDINKQLQTIIGNIIGKDYFKLEFGMEIYIEGDDSKGIFCGEDGNDIYVLYEDYPIRIPRPHYMAILGQEPTLNDVLLAISQKNPCIVRIPRITENTLIELARKEDDVKISYNLEKSIFNQSDETKLAIIKLLE